MQALICTLPKIKYWDPGFAAWWHQFFWLLCSNVSSCLANSQMLETVKIATDSSMLDRVFWGKHQKILLWTIMWICQNSNRNWTFVSTSWTESTSLYTVRLPLLELATRTPHNIQALGVTSCGSPQIAHKFVSGFSTASRDPSAGTG